MNDFRLIGLLVGKKREGDAKKKEIKVNGVVL
jgi:hypothetical protein